MAGFSEQEDAVACLYHMSRFNHERIWANPLLFPRSRFDVKMLSGHLKAQEQKKDQLYFAHRQDTAAAIHWRLRPPAVC